MGVKIWSILHGLYSYLHLQSLDRRRFTADLILTYIIIFGLVDVCITDYLHQLMSADGDVPSVL